MPSNTLTDTVADNLTSLNVESHSQQQQSPLPANKCKSHDKSNSSIDKEKPILPRLTIKTAEIENTFNKCSNTVASSTHAADGSTTCSDSDAGGYSSSVNRDIASPIDSEDDGSGVFTFEKASSGSACLTKSSQKSVCFHSVTCTPGDKKEIRSRKYLSSHGFTVLFSTINVNTAIKCSSGHFLCYSNLRLMFTYVTFFLFLCVIKYKLQNLSIIARSKEKVYNIVVNEYIAVSEVFKLLVA